MKKQRNIKLKCKKGISLIVLIITIIVIIILAAVVILTLTKNNPIESAKEATFKSDIGSIQDELSLYIEKQYTDNNGNYDPTALNLSGDDMVSKLPSTKKYKDKISLEKGELVFTSTNEQEVQYFNEVINGIRVPDDWKSSIVTLTDGNVPIPKGFTYVTGTKNTGVVIQDGVGNEFVWVPVDGRNVKYQKDFSFSSSYGASVKNTTDDTLPIGVSDETSDVTKYGGFYIGRYEAGIPDGSSTTSNTTGIPTSKKGKVSWIYINYINSKANAESMYKDYSFVKSGLLTGKAWDTTCNWLKSTGVNILDSTNYGNYQSTLFQYSKSDGTVVTKPLNTSTSIPTGSTEYTKVNNIYDMAGNVGEWTNEKFYTDFSIYRGGLCNDLSEKYPVSYRNFFGSKYTSSAIGFRIRLYIL